MHEINELQLKEQEWLKCQEVSKLGMMNKGMLEQVAVY